MGRRKYGTNEMNMVSMIYDLVAKRVRRAGSLRFVVLVGLALSLVLAGGAGLTGGVGLTEISSAEVCKNEVRRVEQGSTYLPDCRAYELVTPAEKGATQALVFGGPVETQAIPAEDGEKIALSTKVYLGGNPSSEGTHAVFSRGASGWEMTSLQPPTGAGEVDFVQDVFTPDLTQVGVEAFNEPGPGDHSPIDAFEVGPPGGPYSEVARTPYEGGESSTDVEALVGASADFSHVVLSSPDKGLLPPTAGTADPGKPNLYDWVDGQLDIVDVTNRGKLVSECGATLGNGETVVGPDDQGAVWGEGASSKIFFTSPYTVDFNNTGGPGCTLEHENPHRLYMRVNDSETVEISAPQLEEETANLPSHVIRKRCRRPIRAPPQTVRRFCLLVKAS